MTARPKKPEWPKTITEGYVRVKVYRSKHATNASGFSYEVVWSTATGRRKQPFADPDVAIAEARTKAAQLAAGHVESAQMTGSDRQELLAARKAAGSRPLLTILDEWSKAVELTGGRVLDACEAWSKKHVTKFKRVLAKDAVDEFIASKDKSGKEGERTYGAKLRPVQDDFPDAYLDEISAAEWTTFLNRRWSDGVTRNDHRKRIVTMCVWARDVGGYLPRGIRTEIEYTERAREEPTEIGILTPAVYRECLHWLEKHHPEHLAAIVLSGFCGLRAAEVHGKRGDRDRDGGDSKRQIWEDIDLKQKHLNVTNAKTNTPAWRLVPIDAAAIKWLARCPGERKGPICVPGAVEKARWVLKNLGKFELPDNCFRHSYITYKIAVTGDKARVSGWAGNSVKEIDRRYRRPQLPKIGAAWFAAEPNSN